MKYSRILVIGTILLLLTLSTGCADVCGFYKQETLNNDPVVGTAYFKTSYLIKRDNGHLYDSDAIEYGYVGMTDENPYLIYSGKKVMFMYVDQRICPSKPGRYIVEIIEVRS